MSSDINVQTFSGKVNINNNLLVGSGHLFVDTQNNLVGLRTSDPQAGLHVESNTYVRDDFRVGSGIVMNETTGQITAGSFVGDASLLTDVPGDSGSWVNGTDVVHLATTGDKVGIGVTTLDSGIKLQVNGVVKATGFTGIQESDVPTLSAYATTSALSTGLSTKQDSGSYATTSELSTGLSTKQDSGSYATTSELSTGLSTKQDSGSYATTSALSTGLATKQDSGSYAALAGSTTQAFSVSTLTTSGNVGIGTSSPNHKLEVNGGILADYIGVNFANFYGVRIGYIIENRFTDMPSSAPTDEASMNAEFGSKSVTSLGIVTQMRFDASAFSGTSYTNIARQWLGVILAPTTGTYTFGVNSDDASDLFVAGSRVADWYSGHGYSGTIISPGGNQRTIYLKGGQWYKIKARFEENSGGEAFYALWKKPGDSSFSEIPSDHLGSTQADYSSSVYFSSDDRLKVNEKHITSATDTLLKLKPQVYDKYEMIEDVQNTKKHPVKESGLIAQDVWYDAPELKHLVDSYITPNETRTVSDDIQKDPDYSDWGPYPAQVNYIGFIPYIIKSNQEIYTDLQTTRTQLEVTTLKLLNTEARLGALEQTMTSILSKLNV